ncbi:Calcium-activated chloride channel regulator 1 [Tupaia chinensis]|uniref:Calcium-activated chloride channel regulator 1 n=1 Tax=Tupaia chinensis TaxID=246437 RepID=L8Y799_TUPCH|nr:Calcium-activated chloride channel regulator 1 [Tupaia chinensis]
MTHRDNAGPVYSLHSVILLVALSPELLRLGAGVQLQDNGYDDLLVAINPQVPEDRNLIPNIKANILVTDWYGGHGDDPYTLQYRGCGEEGKYIHFTPNFLLNDNLTAGYGSRGRVFVHEWAHLRWGVFDEYNNDKPFYIDGQNQIKATRCSSDITGIFVCEKGLCPQENCIISKLFQEGCTFIYDSDQNATASIMFMQSLSSADRLLRLQQAAEFYLMEIVEIHTFVGIVSFNSKGEIRSQLYQINSEDDRKLLVSYLPTTVSTEAETSVCSGLKKGFEVVEKLNGKADGSVMVLVTGGEDEHVGHCLLTVLSSGSTIHSIAMGPSAAESLEELSHLTGNIRMNAPRKSVGRNEEKQKWGFSRVSSGGSFLVLGVPTRPHPDMFLPCKITDLEAVKVEEEVTLSWTAPGEDLDQGQGGALSNSLIQLNNNGYEGIVIAIDPNVPEDETLIQHIKADVLVAEPNPPGNDDPYTEQMGKCGEMGEKIYFTPDFLAGKKLVQYGPQGRTFVHEWAHLRWGVFDEYNKDQKFYLSNGKNQAVKCSAAINGKNVVNKCQGGSCVTRPCRPDKLTGLYDKDCEFVPQSQQTEKASIMFAQSIASIGDRLKRLNQAAKLFLLQTVEQGSWVGMVTFDSAAHVQSELKQINSGADRNALSASLPTVASGGTSICSGLRSAFTVIRKKYSTDGSEIALLTDGEDSSISGCFNEVKQSGAIIHTVALGPSAAKELEELSKMTGGLQTYASDQVQNNGLIDAFGALTSGNGLPSQRSIQLESKGLTLQDSQWMNGTVIVDSTVGKDTMFLVTWTTQSPQILLLDPTGKKQEGFLVDTHTKMTYLQIPGTAKVGVWTYSLQTSSQTLTLTVTSRASSATVPPITATSKMNKVTSKFPSPMVVYATIRQGASPILRAKVTALIESENGKTVTLELLDNGAGADATKNDGVYSRYFTAYDTNGRYSVKLWALGGINAARKNVIPQQNGAIYMPGWIENGQIKWNPPRPDISKNSQDKQQCFSRTSSGGSFVVSDVPKAPIPDLFPPCQITDLKAKLEESNLINLTWTAPGDDYDHGTARKYIIRINNNILDLRDKFDDSLQVSTTDLIPQEANSEEVFVFKPENITFENGTDLFIAIQAIDKVDLKSEISNIARVSLFIPPQTPPVTSVPGPNIHINSTVPGIHIIKILWKWLGEFQVSIGG